MEKVIVIKAWTFMAENNGKWKGKYMVTGPNEEVEVFLEKPKPRENPFDYGKKMGKCWKPTRIEIMYKP